MAQMSLEMEKYFESLDLELKKSFLVANKARSKGYDTIKRVDIVSAKNMAERIVGLISVLKPEIKETKIIDRIYELEKQYGSQDWRVALIISVEIAEEKFCKFNTKLEAMEIGIRVGIAYITNGVVASPLEGFTKLELKKRNDGKEYFCVYYSGPIRSAGGTAASVSLIIADYIRKKMGYEAYDIREEELKRGFTEILDYHERVTNLQYFPSEEEYLFMLKNLPIQVDGDPSEKFEVSNYKDLGRIKTNNLRNGPCLVVCEGICQKASKVWKKISQWGKDLGLEHWGFLSEFIDIQKRIRAKDKAVGGDLIKPDYNYIKDLVAGRPVLGYPSRSGSFRLRYGRCRNSGFSSTAIHPVTTILLKNFIGIGCQLKMERPGKATSIVTCDKIDGPIVKLKNGNVLYVNNLESAKKIVNEVEEILYLGDILINYGDFLNRAHILVPCGYNEEWYSLEVEKSIKNNNFKIEDFGLDEGFFRSATDYLINFDQALEISKRLNVPLHPKFTYYWNTITKEMFSLLIDWLITASIEKNKIIFPLYSEVKSKRVLELLGVQHIQVGNEYVVIEGDSAKAFAISLGFYSQELDEDTLREVCAKKDKIIEIVNSVSEIEIRDKCGTFIGARMGRPEKGKMRKLATTPHILFSVGDEGGRLRSFQSALEKGKITSEFPIYYCKKCNMETIYGICERCGNETEKQYYCKECKAVVENSKCKKHGECKGSRLKSIDIKSLWGCAVKDYNSIEAIPPLVKGVRGTSNKDHMVEPILKGVLRAKNRVYVNRDGTTRFDMTELGITHFKPKEIGTSLEKLKQLGYIKDIHGQEILSKEQIIEIKAQDIILPRCLGSKDEGADEILFRVGNFIDDSLKYLYKEETFYNFKNKDDLIGHLIIGLSPHTSAGIVGRILGFSDCQGLIAHPLFHSIMRRDLDGDEACVMLLMDGLLNFSNAYLPEHRGGKQDEPLVLSTRIIPNEVDDMVFDMDIAFKYPLEFYEAAQNFKYPWEVKIDKVGFFLGNEKQYQGYGFTHDTTNINFGNLCSAYKLLPTMEEKVYGQMDLARIIRSVDEDDVARLVLERHFIRDIKGNLRKFSTQQFRCVACNEKFRRPPLQGRCTKCNGRLLFTVAEGSVVKYLEPSLSLIEKYKVTPYLKQTIELTKMRIESVFGKSIDKQVGLGKWFK